MRKIKYGVKKGSISDILATVVPSVKTQLALLQHVLSHLIRGGLRI